MFLPNEKGKAGDRMNLLFVCTGNTCRSAMAEAAAKKMIAQQPEKFGNISVMSAGVMCAGPSAASPQAVMVAASHDCDLSQFTAKQVTETMLEQADYVFAMTRRHKQILDHALPQYSGKTFLLTAYAAGDSSAPDIPDPFGGSVEEYDACFAVLEEMIAAVLEKVAD